MKRISTSLGGLVLLEPTVHGDERGFFIETYSAREHRTHGIPDGFIQDNHSRSRRGSLRGLHYQAEPGQAKLVRVARGRILDVAVDIRPRSATFGQHAVVELDDEAHRQLFIPVGFAHGFLVLSDVADVVYKVTSYYDATQERGIAWDDPSLGIAWPERRPLVSDRDRANPTLAEIQDDLPDW